MQRLMTLLSLAFLSINAIPSVAAAQPLTADEVAQKTGVAGGLCSLPRLTAADEKLAAELAKRPAFVVHVLSQDAEPLARARGEAEAGNTLGRSLYAEKGPAWPLPFADRLVDLLIVTDLKGADLTAELKAEWLRVLAPRRGAALVGRSQAAGGGLSVEALKAWTKDLPLAKVIADEAGVWAVLRADLPAGSDPWSHRCHGPDNSQVSSDATLKPPFLTQWWGLPRQEGFWGTSVVAGNGRMFTLRSSRNTREEVFLTARSLNNGLVLWQKLLRQAGENEKLPHGGYVPGRSCMAVAADTLLLADRDGVLRLNAETGEQMGRIDGPKKGGQVKWLGAVGGLVVMLSGDADVVQTITYQTVAANPNGRELAACEIETGKQAWRQTLAGDVDERLIAARDDRVYTLAQGVGLECRELKTGKTAWANGDTDLQTAFRVPESKALGQYLFSQPVLMALDDVLVLRAVWAKSVAAVSRADGQLLWRQAAGGGRALTSLGVNGLWLGSGGAIDLKTGEKAPGPRFIGTGCGPTTAMPGYLIACFGAVSDMKTGATIRPADIKSPCDVGSLVAEGVMVTVPSECACNFEVKGYRALAAAGRINPHGAGPADRLAVFDQAEPAALETTAADWVSYRHDPQRSAATAATVGEGQPKVLWHWKPANAAAYRTVVPASGPRLAPDYQATAAVAAAGKVWFVSHDGVVRCVQADSGAEVWKFHMGAMAFAPPTISQGRLLVGGGDGRVHCLDATTGKPLWQLLAGPVDRRIFWFGHLISTWPLLAGVTVQDGVAYAVAGCQADNGVHAYGLDVRTGKVLWENHRAGSGVAGGEGGGVQTQPANSAALNAGMASSAGGQTAVGDGRMWLCSSTVSPASYELQSGDWKAILRGGAGFGGEIGVLGGKWVIHGGRRLSETQDTIGKPLGGTGFTAYSSKSPAARVPLTLAGTALPAWDDEVTVMPPKGVGGNLTAVPTAKLLAWLAERAAAPAVAPKAPPAGPKPVAPDWPDFKSWATEAPPFTPVAFALAKDQVVVAYLLGPQFKLSGFRRADGTRAWTVDLPDQPVMNRLAIDRAGRAIVSLCDGSVICVGR